MHRDELTDEQWAAIEPLLPKREVGPGRPRGNDRQTLNGILHVLYTGCTWEEVPRHYGSPATCWRRLNLWLKVGAWERIWQAFLSTLSDEAKADWARAFLDGRFLPMKKGMAEPEQTALGEAEGESGTAAPDEGAFWVNAEGQVIAFDAQLAKTLALETDAVLHKHYTDLFSHLAALTYTPAATLQALEAAFQNRAQRDRPPATYLHLRRSPPVHLRVSPHIRPQGVWGGIVRDFTAEWQEITRQAQYLSAILRELRKSQAQTKGLITTLLSGHQYWEEQKRHSFLESIDRRMNAMKQLLEYGQHMLDLDMGDLTLNRRATALKPRMQQVLDSMAYRTSGCSFKLTVPDDLPPVEVDPARFTQIFTCLLDNAISFAPPKSEIAITAHIKGGELVVRVTSQSVGLVPGQVAHALEANLQTPEGGRRIPDAFLGLYVARELAQAHGGRLWAANPSGHNTLSIYCALPVTAKEGAQAEAGEPRAQPGDSPARARRETNTHKVLVVEDEASTAQLLQVMLNSAGYETIVAADGQAALDLIARREPDIILLDVQLPDLNGMEVYHQLREFSTVPVIIITAHREPELIAQALDQGVADYVVKPIKRPELLARVRARLRRAPAAEAALNMPPFHVGDLVIDFNEHKVTVRGKMCRLPPREYKILELLAANAGHVQTHEQILSQVWGPAHRSETQYVWVYISRLRARLEQDPAHPEYILTEPGVGYFMRAPERDT